MATDTEKEIKQLKNRLKELAEKSYRQNIYCFTGFLNMAELDTFYQMQREISHVPSTLWGGNEYTERKMVRFGSEELFGYREEFPIVCLEIRPAMEKFSEDLGHRDYLGSLMNLGIDRSTMGDILIREKNAYLYCGETIADYICEQLVKVRHTNVICKRFQGDVEKLEPEPEEVICQVASLRLDGIAAHVYGLSRAQILVYFREKKVFRNGRLEENNSRELGEGDLISVRGLGRFRFDKMTHVTRKGKQNIVVSRY